MTFADKLRQARQLRKLSQEELGKLTGVSRRSVISWEMGEATPRSRTLRELADALQVSVDYLKHDEITDPLHGTERKDYIDEARERYRVAAHAAESSTPSNVGELAGRAHACRQIADDPACRA